MQLPPCTCGACFRTVQTDNMMFRTPGGQVVLTDYGVGRIANGGVHESMYDGKGRGHIFTRAPELLDGRHANTFASDVCVCAVQARFCRRI